jgi:hypothetical protein
MFRDEERVGDDVVGGVEAEPARHVAAQPVGVPVEDGREQLGLGPGPFDEARVSDVGRGSGLRTGGAAATGGDSLSSGPVERALGAVILPWPMYGTRFT